MRLYYPVWFRLGRVRLTRAMPLDPNDFPGQTLTIPGDGHPTGVANRAWAVLVRDALVGLAAQTH